MIRMGQWFVDRVSNSSQSYLSRKAGWTIVASVEEKAPVALDIVSLAAAGH